MKKKHQNKQNSTSKKRVLALIGALIVAGLLCGGLYIRSRSAGKDANIPRVPTINYAPATPAEKQEANDAKDRIIVQQKNNTPSSPGTNPTGEGKKTVTPTITNTKGSVNALVSGIFEEGGVCTATFTKGSGMLTKTSIGFQNASYTQCVPMDIESEFLSPGTWSITVSYASTTATGTSVSQTIEVQ